MPLAASGDNGAVTTEELVFEHDLQLRQGNFTDTQKLRLARRRQYDIGLLVQAQPDLAATLVHQPDQRNNNILLVKIFVMMISDNLPVKIRQVPLIKQTQPLLNLHRCNDLFNKLS